jgi:hypothetical protein
MTVEAKLFEGDVAPVSTFQFHEHRERAPHLEQPVHRPRLDRAAQLVSAAAERWRADQGPDHDPVCTVSDLGCGDGGLLRLLKRIPDLEAWGYDFAPANTPAWPERDVEAYHRNVFDFADTRGEGTAGLPINPEVMLGDVVVMTEVLEHLSRPHEVLAWLAAPSNGGRGRYLVCSSPHTETAESHDACHAWAWDMDGYRAMIEAAGWEILVHNPVGMFQLVLAKVRA